MTLKRTRRPTVPHKFAMPLAPDWRWLLDREDTPWYPTMKLFRQQKPHDWPEVISRLAAAITAPAHAPEQELAIT
jgi:hypothetical protein